MALQHSARRLSAQMMIVHGAACVMLRHFSLFPHVSSLWGAVTFRRTVPLLMSPGDDRGPVADPPPSRLLCSPRAARPTGKIASPHPDDPGTTPRSTSRGSSPCSVPAMCVWETAHTGTWLNRDGRISAPVLTGATAQEPSCGAGHPRYHGADGPAGHSGRTPSGNRVGDAAHSAAARWGHLVFSSS